LARQAADERLEERAWLWYCTTAPYQDKKHKQSFEEIMRKLRLPAKANMTTSISDEQLEKFDRIFKMTRGKAK